MQVRMLAGAFDRVYSQEHRRTLEQWVVAISVVGFLAHLGHIFLARNWANAPALVAAADKNYLSAISTPFSFILFYEVLSLISAIPESTTQSIAMQYEIVSLIFIRGFFHDIALVDLGNLHAPVQELGPAFLDVSAGLFMFLLVTAFQHASKLGIRRPGGEGGGSIQNFIQRKKALALGLTALFLSLAAMSVWKYALEVWAEMHRGGVAVLAPPTTFYSDVFTVMIFTDVLILILSLLVSDRYEMVFRNAAFVISTILIRFSLTTEHPYGALLGVVGMVFGIVTVLIYNYNTRVAAPH